MMSRIWFLRTLWLASLVCCAGSIACGEADEGADFSEGDGDSGDGDDGDGDGKTADSCSELDCGSHSKCVEDDDGASCECEKGFALDDDDACVDIDECDKGSDACDDHATCKNTSGDYDCECDDGYMGDGFSCEEEVACEGSECTDGDKCPAGQTGDAAADDCYCDLSGFWAMRHDVTFTVPAQEIGGQEFVKESQTKASLWELHRYDYDGTTIKVQKKGCGADTFPKVVSTVYGESYSSGVPQAIFDQLDLADGVDIPLAKEDAQPDKSFTTPMEAALVGIELDDPLNDPWPASTADVPDFRWVDVEGDGVPGISLWAGKPNCPATNRPSAEETICFTPIELETMSTAVRRRTACVSVASRVVTHLDVTIQACGRLTGSVFNDLTEGRVHSCIQVAESKWNVEQRCTAADWANDDDNVPCSAEQVQFLDEQDQSQESEATFELVKLGGLDATDIDCAAVREKLPAIVRD